MSEKKKTEKKKTMSEEKKTERTEAQILSDAFEGMKGCQPKSDQELNEWLATDEGKQATMFEPTLMSRWGEILKRADSVKHRAPKPSAALSS